jgi:transcriptional antiterminator NusG
MRTQLYVVRTVGGQEANVAKMLAMRREIKEVGIKAVLAPHTLKGYVILEATNPLAVDTLISGLKNVRSRVKGILKFQDVDRYLEVKPIIEEVTVGDVIEVTGGPLRGSRAKIMSIDKSKQEVTIELLDAAFTFSVTLSADYIRIVEKAGGA